MNCSWLEIEAPDADGNRRLRCAVCGFTTLPTYHTIDKVFAICLERMPPAHPELCSHRASEPLRIQICKECGGEQFKIKVFPCAIHGECTIGKKLPGIACCATCPDFSAPDLSK